ncbi:MAG: alpha/beta hydrolase, partial [Lachnospiraceae bacterium]|nr:alpha/beta hydrolase [Lachnospiraceae bacterium]
MIRVKGIQIPELPTVNPRRLYVYLPRDYRRSDRRYPVLYMFDGHNVFYDAHATYGKSWGMKEYLARTGLPLIVAAVECNTEGERRMNEYSPWDLDIIPELGHLEGLGKVTMDWMSGPLKEFIDAEYRTLPGRENTLI